MNTSLILYILLSALFLVRYIQTRRKYPLPPGPPPIPLLGNLHHLPLENLWLYLTKMKACLGSIVSFHGLGNCIVVLSTLDAMQDLLEKRHATYCDRFRMVMVGELAGVSDVLAFMDYGRGWRDQRKVAHAALSSDSVAKYHSLLEETALALCKRLSHTGGNFGPKLRLATADIILATMYGIRIKSADDQYVRLSQELHDFISINAAPGKHLCDMLPFMKYLPSWLPFRQYGMRGRDLLNNTRNILFNHVKQQMAEGTAMPSVARRLLEEKEDSMTESDEDAMKSALASMYTAGNDTMYNTLVVFLLAMTMYPEVQAKAQAEVDTLVGLDRLPNIEEDVGRLPYVNSVLKEVIRWRPVLPFGVPRRVKTDDIYVGYCIPKGATVLPNLWAVSREPNNKYPPEEFIPERFLDPEENIADPMVWSFGFGRRVCPGKLLAERTMLIIIYHVLALLDVQPLSEKPTMASFTTRGMTSHPLPFECNFKPRRNMSVL